MRNILMLVTAVALLAGPALASPKTPQTFATTPGISAPAKSAKTDKATSANTKDPLDPQQNPHNVRHLHR